MKYNEEQQKVIDSNEPNILVIACAGSGKTTTLVGTIKRHQELHPLDRITAITFTKKGAENLAERIDSRNVEISTIHSWAYRRLQRMGAEYGFRVSLLEENVIKDILRKLCNKRGQFYINQFQLYSFVMGNYNIDVDEKIKRVLNMIREDYIRYKRQNGLYDFTDLPNYLYDMCVQYGHTIKDVDALFVDEFQDIDPVQLNVFDIVAAKRRMYIGDDKQAIYGFRGACGDIFNQLCERDEEDHVYNWQVFSLITNYRSRQEIADYATSRYAAGEIELQHHGRINACIEELPEYKHEIKCDRGFGGTVVQISDYEGAYGIDIDTEPDGTERSYFWYYLAPINTIDTFMREKAQILCRTNKQVKKLQAMGWTNVSTIHQAKGLEYDNVVLTDNYCETTEELNILYVGMTRAKNMLCVVDWDVLLYCLANCKAPKPNNTLF